MKSESVLNWRRIKIHYWILNKWNACIRIHQKKKKPSKQWPQVKKSKLNTKKKKKKSWNNLDWSGNHWNGKQKSIENICVMKAWFVEISKTDKPLARLVGKKKKIRHISGRLVIRNKRGDIITNSTGT